MLSTVTVGDPTTSSSSSVETAPDDRLGSGDDSGVRDAQQRHVSWGVSERDEDTSRCMVDVEELPKDLEGLADQTRRRTWIVDKDSDEIAAVRLEKRCLLSEESR